jgi:hypothetical protein
VYWLRPPRRRVWLCLLNQVGGTCIERGGAFWWCRRESEPPVRYTPKGRPGGARRAARIPRCKGNHVASAADCRPHFSASHPSRQLLCLTLSWQPPYKEHVQRCVWSTVWSASARNPITSPTWCQAVLGLPHHQRVKRQSGQAHPARNHSACPAAARLCVSSMVKAYLSSIRFDAAVLRALRASALRTWHDGSTGLAQVVHIAGHAGGYRGPHGRGGTHGHAGPRKAQ